MFRLPVTSPPFAFGSSNLTTSAHTCTKSDLASPARRLSSRPSALLGCSHCGMVVFMHVFYYVFVDMCLHVLSFKSFMIAVACMWIHCGFGVACLGTMSPFGVSWVWPRYGFGVLDVDCVWTAV